ncbi:MAG: hypothetical protein ACD_19C00012G0003 [uncultured bacterium]|nr:MAG: hypothetical protein ACD_19C00012G0003 [uncultured bacterium]
MNENSNKYQTTDLCLATTISLWYSPTDFFKRGNKVIFVFSETKEVTNLISLYWQNKIKVEPKQFFSQLKNLKTRIYSITSTA